MRSDVNGDGYDDDYNYDSTDRAVIGGRGGRHHPEQAVESSPSTRVRFVAMPRRRRKRPLAESNNGLSSSTTTKTTTTMTTTTTTTSKLSAKTKKTVPSLDDTALTFLDNNGNFLADRRAVLSSVPILLAERQLGGMRTSGGGKSARGAGRPRSRQQQMLKHHIKQPAALSGQPRRQWRSFAARSIPFTQLGTPPSDAVLGMDRQGSFVICLGTKDARNAPLALALRFFGIPSPSAVSAQRRGWDSSRSKTTPTPLLQTIPLLFDILDESPEEAIFSFRRGISPATTPVKILLSNDWKMGVALFQPSNVWREEGPVGTLVLFSTPSGSGGRSSYNNDGCCPRSTTIWQCTNVKLGVDASFSHRNLLWKVECVPIMDVSMDGTGSNANGDQAADKFLSVPGYLFFNDENDGFRLTWSMEQDWNVDDGSLDASSKVHGESPIKEGGMDPGEAILSTETSWERFDSDLWSGERIIPPSGKPIGVRIAHERFLRIDILLRDILSRRKGMSGERQPTEYVYNLISVTNGGRVAELIITFIRTQRPGSLGVFVKVDLFTGRYQERSWLKNTNSRDPVALRNWCNALALNHRMKELRMGPYAVKHNHAIDWSKLAIEKSFDPDEEDDFSPSFWEEYVESSEAIATRKPPKLVSLSALYPDCDLVTNKAITDCIPVSSLQGKDSPIQLVYG